MGDSRTPQSIAAVTADIDTGWDEVPEQDAPESDRPTALPPEPPDQFARRLMAEAMLSDDGEPLRPRSEQPTLLDHNAGTYDLDTIEATIPQVTSPAAHRSIPLELQANLGGALDLVGGAHPLDLTEPDPLLEMRDRYAVGDFTGALAIAEKVLDESPSNGEANRYMVSCRDILTQMYTARLGSTGQVPRVLLGADQVRWLTLDHRSGFLLACIDGACTIEEILDVSGMQPLDALRILCELLQQGVIEMKPRKP
jgi:hypothetical protein